MEPLEMLFGLLYVFGEILISCGSCVVPELLILVCDVIWGRRDR